jgi:hypothetical protein
MSHRLRVTVTVASLALSLALAGCGSFDPTAILDADIFNSKKKLPGERRPVFPEGTPGVSQGVPPELVKGYEAPPEPEPAKEAQPAEAKPKPRPQPKVVARPKEEAGPTAVTVRPSPAQPQAQPQSQPPSQPRWPDPPPMPAPAQQAGGVVWPDPPAPR